MRGDHLIGAELLSDDLERLAQGVSDVDRAVRRARRAAARVSPPFDVPADVAARLGWPRCLECDGPIPPGYRVAWRGGHRHVECTLSRLLGPPQPLRAVAA
jgi:hypothetical protein